MTASTKPDLNQVVASRRRAIDPALGETCLTSLSDLNRLVRTRMLGGVGRAVSNGRPYPIRLAAIEAGPRRQGICTIASTPRSASSASMSPTNNC